MSEACASKRLEGIACLLREDCSWWYKNDVGFAKTGRAYVNFWVRWDWGTSKANRHQIKTWRIATLVAKNCQVTNPCLFLIDWRQAGFPNRGGYIKTYYQNYYISGSSSIDFPDNTLAKAQDRWVHVAPT
jgi:hypothetical protein